MKRFIRTHWEAILMALVFAGSFILAGTLDEAAYERHRTAQHASR